MQRNDIAMSLKAAILKFLSRKTYTDDFRPETFKNILIVRPAKIGDTICMFPLIRELNRFLPDAKIDIYASTYNNFMFQHAPQVRHVYTKYKDRDSLKTVAEIFEMRTNRYDLIIDTIDIRFGKVIALAFIKARWLIANVGYESRYGLNNADLDFYYKLTDWKQIHTTDRLLEFLQLLGIDDYDSSINFPIGDEAYQFAESFLKPYQGKKLIGLNADASDRDRSILDAEIIDICNGIKAFDSKIRILLFSSVSRREHMAALIKQARFDNVILENGTTSIFEAAALTSFMNVMISPNTSFVHIASAFDIPTVAIFQNDQNHLTYWAPRSSRYIIIKPEKPGTSVRGFSVNDTVNATIDLIKDESYINQPPFQIET
ncbi:MAG: glycosyltransferase family 9 protein [Gammaproteobacteria bacterium]|nr:glycosyltransferase family 9 protein [Gammaproteobacteria bacterium]